MSREVAVLAAAAFFLWHMTSSKKTRPGASRSNVSAQDRTTLVTILADRGWPMAELDAAIMIESGWRTDARNPVSDASGLIQLMPAWFARHDFRADLATGKERAAAFRAIGAIEQLPWIELYFDEVGRKWRVPGDTYLAFAAPSYVGRSDETIIYGIGSKAWQQNPAWRDAEMGPITAGSIRRVLLRRMKGSANV